MSREAAIRGGGREGGKRRAGKLLLSLQIRGKEMGLAAEGPAKCLSLSLQLSDNIAGRADAHRRHVRTGLRSLMRSRENKVKESGAARFGNSIS